MFDMKKRTLCYEGRTGGAGGGGGGSSLARFMSLKNRESRFMDIEISFS